MTAKSKVLHIIGALNTGGAEMMLCKLLSQRDRFDESIISLSQNLDTVVARKIQALGVEIMPLGFRKTSLNLGPLRALIRAVKALDPDVIHTWMYHSNAASAWVRRFAPRASLVWNVRHSLHDIKLERPLIKASIRLNRRYSHRPDAIVYNSKTSAAQHEAFGFSPERSVVLPNGFDCDVFSPDAVRSQAMRTRFELDPHTLAIGVVARYHEMKGHDVCLQAAKIAAERGVDFKLFLIGAGMEQGNTTLVDLIADYGIENRVVLVGEQAQLENFHRMLDVLVCSSLWGEAFSNAIGEAMACAVPCIVTDVGDSAWIVSDTGTVVAPGDAVALAEAIIQIAGLPAAERKQRGRSARQRVLDHFSIQNVAHLYDELYRQLIDTARPANS